MSKVLGMRKIQAIVMATIAAGALSACSSGGSILGGGTDPVATSRQVALVLPPDFGAAPPPAGTAGNVGAGNEAEVLEALFGGPAPRPFTEVDVLSKAGRADLGIRSTVADPLTPTVNKGQATVDILRSPEGNNPGVSVGVGG